MAEKECTKTNNKHLIFCYRARYWLQHENAQSALG